MTTIAVRQGLTTIMTGGSPVVALYGPLTGGVITNPVTAAEQGVPVAEILFYNFYGPAALVADGTTCALYPGQTADVPAGLTTNVSVNALTSGHKFSAVVWNPPVPYPPVPQPGDFPVSAPASVQGTIASYLYEEYNDDDNLQGFVNAYNTMAQQYVDWFNQINLPIYTGQYINGALADWVMTGLYGLPRPALPSGFDRLIGPLNTWPPNTIPVNALKRLNNQTFYATTDDIYKRILTWLFFKGDGKYFSIRWLKRRIVRFLNGVNGTDPPVDQTYQISVGFGKGGICYINILGSTRQVTGGALPNRFGLNQVRPNQLDTIYLNVPVSPFALVLKAAIDSGVCELPFQYTFIVSVT